LSLQLVAALGVILMVVLMFMGMNIGLAMMAVGFFGYWYIVNFDAAIGVLRTVPATQATNYSFVVIPLFILMGSTAFVAGLSNGLFDAGAKWLSRLPGGLACATIAACAGFGAVCGSVIATTATMGTVAIPEMRKHGYSDSLSTGCVAAGGGLGILIPPSTPMIIYGISAEQSIGRLLASGVGPGIVQAIIMMAIVVIAIKLIPSWGPKGFKCSWKERFESLKGLILVAVLFGFVFGGMFGGIFTVNEAAAFGAFLGFLMMLMKKKLNWENFLYCMKDTVKTSSMVFLLLIGAIVMNNFLAVTQMPMKLADFIGSLEVSRYVIFAIIILIYMFLGAIMDELPMILLTVPIFLPVIMNLGFDPVWFGAIIVLVMNMGLILPPVGLSCFVIAGVCKDVPLTTIFKGSLPFLIAMLLTITLCVIFPGIALWLPNLIYG